MRLYRQRLRRRGASNIDVTPFISLMVILVPFLLVSTVFSRSTILELQGASAQAGGSVSQDSLQLQLIVREAAIEVSYSGRGELLRIPRTDAGGELEALSRLMDELKRNHPQSYQATLLLEPQIPYDVLVQVMDSVRVKQVVRDGVLNKSPLFPAIALAETPALTTGQAGGR